MGVWSPKSERRTESSTNPGLVGLGVGIWRKAKWLSGRKLENAGRIMTAALAEQGLQERVASLEMEPNAATDVA